MLSNFYCSPKKGIIARDDKYGIGRVCKSAYWEGAGLLFCTTYALLGQHSKRIIYSFQENIKEPVEDIKPLTKIDVLTFFEVFLSAYLTNKLTEGKWGK